MLEEHNKSTQFLVFIPLYVQLKLLLITVSDYSFMMDHSQPHKKRNSADTIRLCPELKEFQSMM